MLVAFTRRSLGPRWYVEIHFLVERELTCSQPDTKEDPGDTNVTGGYLQYNEFICYDVAQVRLRYLLRVKM